MKPTLQWCRTCVCAHAPGEHTKKATTVASRLHEADLPGKIDMDAGLQHIVIPIAMPNGVERDPKLGKQYSAALAASFAQTKGTKIRNAQPIDPPKPPAKSKAKKARKRSKVLSDPAAELTRRRAQKAAQMARYRARVKERLK